jgi:4-amino-4-deoxy-L-arabinose transferase-like glycosyltransferase
VSSAISSPSRRRPRIPPLERVDADDSYSVLRDRVVWILAGVALAVQLLYVWLGDVPTWAGDQRDYTTAASHFGAWWAFPNPTLQRMPGYPLLLSLPFRAGLGEFPIQLLQAIALALGTLAVASLARLVSGRPAARAAAGLYAIYVPLLSFSAVLLTEAVTIALGLAATVCAVRATTDAGGAWVRWVVLAALALAFSTLIRSDQIVLTVVLTATVALTAPTWRRRLTAVGIVALAFLVMFGPWVGRNLALSHHLEPFGTSGRYPTAIGVHLPFDREVGQFSTYRRSFRFWSGTRRDGFSPDRAAVLDVKRELRENVLHHTGEFAVTRAIGQAQLWVWPVTANSQYNTEDPVPYVALMLLHLFVLLAGLAGFVAFHRHVVMRIGMAMFLCVAGLHLVTFPQPRYALTVMPLLIVGAGALTVRVADRRRDAARRRR